MQNYLITKLKKINRTEIEITFENGDSYKINNDICFKYELARQKIISDEALQKLIREQNIIDAKQIAYKYATFKMRTEGEILNKLQESDLADYTSQALSFLQKHKLIDDSKYVKVFSKEKFKLKGWSYYRLRDELRKRHIQKDLFESVYPDLFTEEEQIDRGLQVAEKKLKTLKEKDDFKRNYKLKQYLVRYGYPEHIIQKILGALH